MLFRKKIQRCCAYCIHSAKLDTDQVLCAKKGVKELYASCRKFRYDPCKRIPSRPKAMDFSQYDDRDYSL